MKKILFLPVMLLITLSVFSDEVLLKNGDKLTGEIMAVDTDTLLIRTGYGKLEIMRADLVKAVIDGSSQSVASPASAAPVEQAEWVTVLNEDFSSSASRNRWTDVSRLFGDGKIEFIRGALRLTRGNRHYGWAECPLQLNSETFEITFSTKGVMSNDPYDRGVFYLLDGDKRNIFSLDVENYRNYIRLYSYEYDSAGNASPVTICDSDYREDDGMHTFKIKKEGSKFTVSVDGRVRCSGNYSGEASFQYPAFIRISGRGSNFGSGLDYSNIIVREYK